MRNNKRDWVLGFCKGFPTATNIQMELLTLLEGLKLIENHNLHPVDINIDSKEVINMLKNGNLHYILIIDAYRSMLRRVGHQVVVYCFREQN